MNLDDVRVGLKVKTMTLGSTGGFFLEPLALDPRRSGVVGTVRGQVSGCGGDVWWVQHVKSGVAVPYAFNSSIIGVIVLHGTHHSAQ